MKSSCSDRPVERRQCPRWLAAPVLFGQHAAVVEFLVRFYCGSSKKVLDLGARRSPYTRSLPGLVVGLDLPAEADAKLGFNPASLRQFGQGRQAAVFGSGESLPFKPGTFDAVLLIEVIEHIQEDRQAVDEIFTVLKPGGVLILCTPNGETFPQPAKYHIRHYQPEELKKIIKERFEIKRFWSLFPKGKLWLESIKSVKSMIEKKDIIALARHLGLIWIYWLVTAWWFFRGRTKNTTTLFVVAEKVSI